MHKRGTPKFPFRCRHNARSGVSHTPVLGRFSNEANAASKYSYFIFKKAEPTRSYQCERGPEKSDSCLSQTSFHAGKGLGKWGQMIKFE